MSGGVDSSVAAARVAASGHRAFGVTLALWPRDRAIVRDRGCCSIDAVDDARRVANALSLPHYVWNLEQDFEGNVVRDFEDGYAAGLTPNPCVRCNQRVKFGVLLERARAAGATHLATGHYARTGRRGPLVTLHRARDRSRDQAYVLHRLDQDQLSSAVFALGGDELEGGRPGGGGRAGSRHRGQARSRRTCALSTSTCDPSCGAVSPVGSRRGRSSTPSGAALGEPRGPAVLHGGPARRPRHRSGPTGRGTALRHRAQAGGEHRRGRVARCAASLERRGGLVSVGRRNGPDAGHGVRGAAASAWRSASRTRRGDRSRRPSSFGSTSPVDQAAPGQSVVLYRDDEVLGGGMIRRAA